MKRVMVITGFLFVLQVSCTPAIKKDKHIEDRLQIKFINLDVVYNYLIKNDQYAGKLKQNRVLVEMQLDQLYVKKKGLNPDIVKKQEKLYQQKLLKAVEKEKAYKKKLLQKINIVIKRVADKYKADYILNIGDEVVYGDKKHDLTVEVIREIDLLNRRSAPVSR